MTAFEWSKNTEYKKLRKNKILDRTAIPTVQLNSRPVPLRFVVSRLRAQSAVDLTAQDLVSLKRMQSLNSQFWLNVERRGLEVTPTGTLAYRAFFGTDSTTSQPQEVLREAYAELQRSITGALEAYTVPDNSPDIVDRSRATLEQILRDMRSDLACPLEEYNPDRFSWKNRIRYVTQSLSKVEGGLSQFHAPLAELERLLPVLRHKYWLARYYRIRVWAQAQEGSWGMLRDRFAHEVNKAKIASTRHMGDKATLKTVLRRYAQLRDETKQRLRARRSSS